MSGAKFCESCGAGLHDGAQFCGSCGHRVVEASAAPVASPVESSASPREGRASAWAFVVGVVVAVALAVGVVVLVIGGDDGTDSTTRSTTAAANVTRLEAVGSVTPAAFTGSIGTVTETAITGAPTSSATEITGSTVGLYGGSGDAKVCDAEQLVSFLDANPAKARAFAGVLGIATADIPAYVRGLTPVLLTRDTRVTNHGFANGAATTVPAVLQAGTAVLVDRYGVPRVKCACGNPLTPPTSTTTRAVGTAWPGYSRTTVIVVVAAPRAVDSFVLVNTTGSGYVRITVGASGTVSVLTAAEYCAANPTDPACAATTTTPPTTAPPATAPPATSPPTVDTNAPEDAVALWIGQQGYSYAGDCAIVDPSAGPESMCSTLVDDGAIVKTYRVGFPFSEYVAQLTVTRVAGGWWEVSDVQEIGAVG